MSIFSENKPVLTTITMIATAFETFFSRFAGISLDITCFRKINQQLTLDSTVSHPLFASKGQPSEITLDYNVNHAQNEFAGL